MKDLSKRAAWIALFLAVGVLTHWLPHPANFSATLAIAMFAGYVLPGSLAVVVTLASLALGDALVGFYSGAWVVYASLIPAIYLGSLMPDLNSKTWMKWGLLSFLANVFFFITTNFEVWYMSDASGALGSYPHTFDGLMTCYAMALPFFKNSLLSTWVYMGVFEAVRRMRPAAFPVAAKVS